MTVINAGHASSDAGGCDYCIHTGKERGCDVEVCDKAVVGERLTKK